MGSIKTCNSCEMEKLIFGYSCNNVNDLYQNHHVIKGARILSLEKLSSKDIYSILISSTANKPTSNIYFEKLIWVKYTCHRFSYFNSTLRSFQYKIFNEILSLNKKLYTFGITNTTLFVTPWKKSYTDYL